MFPVLHLLTKTTALRLIHTAAMCLAITAAAAWVASMENSAAGATRVWWPMAVPPFWVVPETEEAATRSAMPRRTFFIVDSEETAAALRAGIVETAAILWQAGMVPGNDEILVVPDLVDAERLAELIRNESSIQVYNGSPAFEVIVVDRLPAP